MASEIKIVTDDQVVTETFGDNQGKNSSGKSGKYEAKFGKSVLYYDSPKHSINRDHVLAHGFILGRNP